MAILFRNTADLLVGGMKTRLTVYSHEGRLRAELIPDPDQATEVYTGALDVTVTYNGVSKRLTAAPFTKAVSAVFPEIAGQKSLSLTAAAGFVYGGAPYASVTIAWKGDGSLTGPVLRITSFSGLRLENTSRVAWTADGVPEGYIAYTLGVWMYFAPRSKIVTDYRRSCLIGQKSTDFSLEHTIDGLEEKNTVFYRIAVGLYRAGSADSAGRDDYEYYLEIDTPVHVCSGGDIYTLAPCGLHYALSRRNRVVNITWSTVEAASATKGYRLDYSCDGSSWTQIFWDSCPSASSSFTVPAGAEKIAFRILSYSDRSKYEQSTLLYGPWLELGQSNVYVGYHGGVVPAAEIHIGSAAANAVLNVG